MAPIRLKDAPLREELILSHGQAAPALKRRLATLGLRNGCTFQLLMKTASGGRIALVGESRIALGPQMLSQLQYRLPEAK
ncbi:MAG: ferrous iron transport protein A [Propionibacteriaceae bacterium]|nr:ferrous iron transport protein A [Propionibacteriaceae bacterium]